MNKKIVWGLVLFGLVGILVAGAVVRTAAKTGDVVGARGGHGQNQVNPEGSPNNAGAVLPLQDDTGTGQAQVDEWLTLEGTVVSVDADALVVQTTAGEQVVVENRPWSFAQEQGFAAQPGDQVTLVGFYEDDTLEVGQIADATNGQTVQLRDETGWPMWAGHTAAIKGQRQAWLPVLSSSARATLQVLAA
jgi:hypothetical protein